MIIDLPQQGVHFPFLHSIVNEVWRKSLQFSFLFCWRKLNLFHCLEFSSIKSILTLVHTLVIGPHLSLWASTDLAARFFTPYMKVWKLRCQGRGVCRYHIHHYYPHSLIRVTSKMYSMCTREGSKDLVIVGLCTCWLVHSPFQPVIPFYTLYDIPLVFGWFEGTWNVGMGQMHSSQNFILFAL